jgi:GntR family transcriptional regulator / MocR family aminotransferase
MIQEKKSPATLLKIDRATLTPLHRQIYERFRAAIEQGVLRAGDRVASARSLASELGVARGTVETAYNQLAGEGYFSAQGQAGTVVSPSLPSRLSARRGPRQAEVPAFEQTLAEIAPPLPLQLGIPALDAFPRKLWARLVSRRARATTTADMFYGDPSGHPALRAAIAAYLRVSRGVLCHPSQVFVTGGYRASLALSSHTLLGKDDRVWIEDPGYPPTRQVLRSAGQRVVPVPVDEEGMVVAQGMRKAAKAKMAVVTPSHQAPLGVSMSLARRLQLLDWASQAKAWIVEDDYDGEYRYAGPPLPALKSLDGHDRVLYAGSFSKVLYPGLALGYVVAPDSLRDVFAQAAQTWSNGSPQIMQAVVADFMREGHFSRHLKKMRLLYARRRNMLAEALLKALGDEVRIDLQSGGMHLIARFDRWQERDEELGRRAQLAGLNCQPLSVRGTANFRDRGLLMGFTNIGSAVHAQQLARTLKAALDRRL